MFRISLLLAMCFFVLTGCDVARCIINDHPEFSKNSVREAQLNQVYEDTIKVSISNSYEDYRYNYSWTLDGDLPQGIEHEVAGREVRFTGTPTELGDFSFQLGVLAKPSTPNIYAGNDDGPSTLCSNSESRDMVLSVVQGF